MFDWRAVILSPFLSPPLFLSTSLSLAFALLFTEILTLQSKAKRATSLLPPAPTTTAPPPLPHLVAYLAHLTPHCAIYWLFTRDRRLEKSHSLSLSLFLSLSALVKCLRRLSHDVVVVVVTRLAECALCGLCKRPMRRNASTVAPCRGNPSLISRKSATTATEQQQQQQHHHYQSHHHRI